MRTPLSPMAMPSRPLRAGRPAWHRPTLAALVALLALALRPGVTLAQSASREVHVVRATRDRVEIDAGSRADVALGSSVWLAQGAPQRVGIVAVVDPSHAWLVPTPGVSVAAGTAVVVHPGSVDSLRPSFAYSGSASHPVWLDAGEEVRFGTCGLEGASYWGDTVLELRDESGAEVAMNDDACGLGSMIQYRVPPGRGGRYEIYARCYGRRSCGGVVAIASRQGIANAQRVPFTATATDDARRDTTQVALPDATDRVLLADTCEPDEHAADDVPREERAMGPAQLRVTTVEGEPVATERARCPDGRGVALRHAAFWDARPLMLHVGCAGASTCRGAASYAVVDDPAVFVRSVYLELNARVFPAIDHAGAGLLGDASLTYRQRAGPFTLRFEGAPLAVGGGDVGGVYSAAGHVLVGLHSRDVELALGAGASSVNTQNLNRAAPTAPSAEVYLRLGPMARAHLELALTAGLVGNVTFLSMYGALLARFDRAWEFVLRGGGGPVGFGYGELGLLRWVVGDGVTGPSAGLSVTLGAAGAFYQPGCLLGVCAARGWYAGPSAGAGLQVRF